MWVIRLNTCERGFRCLRFKVIAIIISTVACFPPLVGRSSQEERWDGEVQSTRGCVKSRGSALPHDPSGQHAQKPAVGMPGTACIHSCLGAFVRTKSTFKYAALSSISKHCSLLENAFMLWVTSCWSNPFKLFECSLNSSDITDENYSKRHSQWASNSRS